MNPEGSSTFALYHTTESIEWALGRGPPSSLVDAAIGRDRRSSSRFDHPGRYAAVQAGTAHWHRHRNRRRGRSDCTPLSQFCDHANWRSHEGPELPLVLT